MHLLEVAEASAFACAFVCSCFVCNEKMKFIQCKHNYFHFINYLVSFVLFRRIYDITPNYYSLSEKLVRWQVWLQQGIAGLKQWLKTITKQCNIYFPCSYMYSSHHIPLLWIFPTYLTYPVKQNKSEFWITVLMDLLHFLGPHLLC